MTTAYSPLLQLALPVEGELSGSWGDVINQNITAMLEEAIAGRVVINTWTANAHTLTTANGTTSEARCAFLDLTDSGGALTGAGTVICPATSKLYVVNNNTGEAITVRTAAGTGPTINNASAGFVACDGTNVIAVAQDLNNPEFVSPRITDVSGDYKYIFVPETLAADQELYLPALSSGGDEFIFSVAAASLSNKTISLSNNTLLGSPAEYDATLTEDAFVFQTEAITLTNKTINFADNSIVTTVALLNASISDGSVATLAGAETLTNKTLTAPTIATITNGGTVTVPSGTHTLVARSSTDTLTNKTINLTSNTLSGTVSQFNAALSDGSFATLDNNETLTGKTLTSPVLNGSLTGTGVIDDDTMASASDTTVPTSESVKAYVDSVAGGGVFLSVGEASTLLVSAGEITITGSHHQIDTQSYAATDELHTISGGSEGTILLLRGVNIGRVTTVQNGIGNISIDSDYDLTSFDTTLWLIKYNTQWYRFEITAAGP